MNRNCVGLLAQWLEESLQDPTFPSTLVSSQQKDAFRQRLLRYMVLCSGTWSSAQVHGPLCSGTWSSAQVHGPLLRYMVLCSGTRSSLLMVRHTPLWALCLNSGVDPVLRSGCSTVVWPVKVCSYHYLRPKTSKDPKQVSICPPARLTWFMLLFCRSVLQGAARLTWFMLLFCRSVCPPGSSQTDLVHVIVLSVCPPGSRPTGAR